MELISFEAAFYKSGDFVYDTERGYRFAMNRKEDGTFFIREDNDGLECETGEEFATKLQKLIRDYNLVKFNGVQKRLMEFHRNMGHMNLRQSMRQEKN